MIIKGILVTLIAPFENHIANGGDKLLGNMPTIKKRLDERAYISGQMQRHSLFSAIDRINIDDQEDNHIGENDDQYTYVSNADGITSMIERDLRADMGGFMHPIGTIGSIRRTSPISATPAVAIDPSKIGNDLLVCVNNNPNEDAKKQAIVTVEYSQEDDMRMNFFLDITSLSIYKTYEYDGNFHVKTVAHKFANESERKRRARIFLEATRFLNDYANQARNEVCGEPQKVFIVFDPKLSRKASRYFKAKDKGTEQKRIIEELNDRGAVFFYGDDTDEKCDSVLTAYKKAMQFLNENELYTCFPEDKVEKFEDIKSLINNIKKKTEENKGKSKNKQDKEESPNSDEQA